MVFLSMLTKRPDSERKERRTLWKQRKHKEALRPAVLHPPPHPNLRTLDVTASQHLQQRPKLSVQQAVPFQTDSTSWRTAVELGQRGHPLCFCHCYLVIWQHCLGLCTAAFDAPSGNNTQQCCQIVTAAKRVTALNKAADSVTQLSTLYGKQKLS
jgi:hypothetical protein